MVISVSVRGSDDDCLNRLLAFMSPFFDAGDWLYCFWVVFGCGYGLSMGIRSLDSLLADEELSEYRGPKLEPDFKHLSVG